MENRLESLNRLEGIKSLVKLDNENQAATPKSANLFELVADWPQYSNHVVVKLGWPRIHLRQPENAPLQGNVKP